MKIGLISGHGAGSSGAVACGYVESELTIEVVKLLDGELRKRGVDTVIYPYDHNAYDDIVAGGLVVDFRECEYVLEVHFNACVNDESGNGKTTGVEIYVTPREQGTSVERAILRKIAALGFRDRGVKVNNFLVINKVKNLGVSSALLECCFIDDKDDMDLFIAKKNEYIKAVADGIVEGFGVDTSEVVDTPAAPIKTNEELAQEVIRGDWGNGTERKRRLTQAGYDYEAIQAIVNGQSTVQTTRLSNEEVAKLVLRGDYGNGSERRQKLEAEGYDYDTVQRIVNSMV